MRIGWRRALDVVESRVDALEAGGGGGADAAVRDYVMGLAPTWVPMNNAFFTGDNRWNANAGGPDSPFANSGTINWVSWYPRSSGVFSGDPTRYVVRIWEVSAGDIEAFTDSSGGGQLPAVDATPASAVLLGTVTAEDMWNESGDPRDFPTFVAA